jgi:hypothetical protein
MKSRGFTLLIAMGFALSGLALAADVESKTPVHKYWTCAISSYSSAVDDNYQKYTCRANTQYSNPPCREFVVEYDGDEGVRPGDSYRAVINQNNAAKYNDGKSQAETSSIEIKSDKDKYVYTHTVVKTGLKFSSKWVYNGVCHYYEAPASEKIYMDEGLKTE